MWTWAISKVTGLVAGSVSKVALYGGLIVAGLGTLLSIILLLRKGGADANRVKNLNATLRSVARKNKISRDIDGLDTNTLRERAKKWQS